MDDVTRRKMVGTATGLGGTLICFGKLDELKPSMGRVFVGGANDDEAIIGRAIVGKERLGGGGGGGAR